MLHVEASEDFTVPKYLITEQVATAGIGYL